MVTGTKATSEVSLSIAMVSLPVGGMITRIACGSTIRRRIWPRLRPSACAASVCPGSTDWMPARTISAMYAASDSAERQHAGDEAGEQVAGASKPKSRSLEVVDAEERADLPVEREPELDPGPQDAEVAEEDRQHQPGHRPEEPGVDPGDAAAGSGSATAA